MWRTVVAPNPCLHIKCSIHRIAFVPKYHMSYNRSSECLCMIPMVVQEKERFLDIVVAHRGSSPSFSRHSYHKTINVYRRMVRSQKLPIYLSNSCFDVNFTAGHEGTGKHSLTNKCQDSTFFSEVSYKPCTRDWNLKNWHKIPNFGSYKAKSGRPGCNA
jgi:hypothetical protein